MSGFDFSSIAPTGVAPPPRKKKPSGIGAAGGVTVAARPAVNPPSDQLAKHGFVGSPEEFDHRIGQARATYRKIKGADPPAGLAFDVARSQVPHEQFGQLFAPLGLTRTAARAVGIGAAVGAYQPLEQQKLEPGTRLQGAQQRYIDQHPEYGPNPVDVDKASYGSFDKAFHQRMSEAGFDPGTIGRINSILSPAPKAAEQVVTSLAESPFGVYILGRAASLDTWDAAHGRFGSRRTERVAKAVGQGFVEDFRHPSDRAGFLFLDLLGILTAAGGTAARLGAAGRAASEGGGLAAAGKALVKRPEPGTYTFKVGDLEANKLLSDNATVRFVQRQVYKQMDKRVAARQAEDRTPAAASDLRLAVSAKRFYDDWLAGEVRIAREQRAASRVEQASRLAILGQLRKAVGFSGASSRVLSRFPAKVRHGLSRGENKAIQVLSVGEPISAWENFHKTMIRDSGLWAQELNINEPLLVKNHERHLADLRLARRVLGDPGKQSKRFRDAAQLAKEVSDEMTRAKVEELGLSPFVSEQRVRSQAAVVREGKPASEIAPEELAKEPTLPFGDLPQGFYSPFQSPRHARNAPQGQATYAIRGSQYGVGPPVDLPELNHVFTGDSILAGDFRIDAANLIGDSYAKTVRVASLWSNYKQLLSASRAKPPVKGTDEEQYLVPIRQTRAIPPALKEMLAKIDEGTFTEQDAIALGEDAKTIIEKMYPDGAPVDEVRWVDSRLMHRMIGGLASRTTGAGAVLYTANELVRLPILFLRPAYILNLLGNVGMGIIHQGFPLGPNIVRGLMSHRFYGDRNTAWIDELVGNSRSRSYVNPDVRGLAHDLTRGSQAVANWWNLVADQHLRRSAFIYEARRKGYVSQEDMTRLRTSPDLAKDRMEITRRSNKAMVEFDNLTRFEKMWLRNLIFVYPWVSRSAVWSVRTLVEHPIKTNVLAHLGDEQNYPDEPLVKMWKSVKTPEWFKQAGYFPVAFQPNGDPKVVSGRTINTFSTLADLVHPFEGMYSAGPETTPLEDLLGPVPTFALHAVTGRDRYGDPYKGGGLTGAAKEQFAQLPQTSALKRAGTEAAPPGSAAKTHPTFVPGLWDAYGPLLASLLAPREADAKKLEYDYWREQPPTARVEQQIQAVRALAKLQSDVLDRPIPPAVKNGLDLLAERMRTQARWAEDHGRTPGARIKRALDITVLQKQGKITPEQATKLRSQLADAKSDHDFGRFGAMLDKQYLGGRALEDWHSDVNTVLGFEKTYGTAYGRHFLEVSKEEERLLQSAFAAPAATGEQAVAFAKVAAYEEQQDRPFNGHPSPIREAWNRQTPEDRQKKLAKLAGQPWEFLSTFDKELLGRKPSGDVAKGWEQFVTLRQEAKDKLPAGHKTFPKGYLDQLARYTDRYYAKGFYRDWLVSREPLAQRLMLGGFTPAKLAEPLEKSSNREMWSAILKTAGSYAKLLRDPDYPKTQIRDTWKQYVETSLLPWARSNPSMKKELDLFGPNFLYSLLS